MGLLSPPRTLPRALLLTIVVTFLLVLLRTHFFGAPRLMFSWKESGVLALFASVAATILVGIKWNRKK
jgi:hypothetical protein